MEIIWTVNARFSFYNNISFLENKWNEDVAMNFEIETLRVIDIIQKNPHIGRYDEDFRCNLIVVVKQISLLYEIKNDKIFLLLFWNNIQKPIKGLKF